jgi:hypothetical protein
VAADDYEVGGTKREGVPWWIEYLLFIRGGHLVVLESVNDSKLGGGILQELSL